MYKNIFFIAIAILYSISSYAQKNYTITIPENRYKIDNTNQLIVCNFDVTNIPDFSTFDTLILGLDTDFQFSTKPIKISYQQSYEVKQNGKSYTLFFSKIPLVIINIDQEIADEPKRPANFIYTDFTETKVSLIGIEKRGGFSQSLPKKTYDIEFWKDSIGEESKNLQFGNLREDDDWILDALYNEPLRLRAYSSHQLWLDMHTPYYIDEEKDAKSGANVMYVDMFLNDMYNGIYMLSEQVDRKQLKLKKFKNGKIRGELYKAEKWITGNAKYEGLPEYDNTSKSWGGQELKYPNGKDIIKWETLYNFTDFVINSELDEFRANIADQLQIDNAIDYFIFLNLIRAADNKGKNLYTAKYSKNSPYFFVPWDLDGVFGTLYTGKNVDITDDILSNGLF